MEMVSKIHFDHKAMVKDLELLTHPTKAGNETLVSGIIEHLTTHFRDEESCMRVYGYPNTENHEVMHEKIQDQLVGMLTAMTPIEDQLEALEELKHRILDHILLEDEKFMEYLKDKD
jgi:hemerythrin-like metal-binding protein